MDQGKDKAVAVDAPVHPTPPPPLTKLSYGRHSASWWLRWPYLASRAGMAGYISLFDLGESRDDVEVDYNSLHHYRYPGFPPHMAALTLHIDTQHIPGTTQEPALRTL